MDVDFDFKPRNWWRVDYHVFYASLLPWNRVLAIGPVIIGWWQHPQIQTLGI